MTESRAVGGDAPDVSVVIVNWNTRELLRGCLASIAAETSASHEVIVVDNNSSDGSAAMVAEDFPDVRLIANKDNRGFAAGNNQGLAIARGRHLLLLNPDTVVLDGAIDTMLRWLAQHPDVGCVGCQVWETPERIQLTCFADPVPLNLFLIESGLMRLAPRLFGGPDYCGWDRLSQRDVDVVTGMFMLIPRAVLDVVGVLDEGFFIFAEEADLCRRIRAAGWRCVFAPEARILHLDGGGKSTVQVKPAMHVQLQKSLIYYNAKHGGVSGRILARAIYSVSAFARWIVFTPIGWLTGSAREIARARLAYAALAWHVAGRDPRR